MKKVKKFVFPSTALIVSLYISGLFALGIIFGYFCTILFHKKIVAKGMLRPIIFNLGKWRFHLHHWLMGGLILLSIWLSGYMPFLPKFCWGMAGGLIFHDIYSDREWFKIIERK